MQSHAETRPCVGGSGDQGFHPEMTRARDAFVAISLGPLHLSHPTLVACIGMSQKCQDRTHAVQQSEAKS